MSVQLDEEVRAARARLGWGNDALPGQCCAVAGYDGTSPSVAALAYATGWAQRNRGAVVVVHVDPVIPQGLIMAECAGAMTGAVVPELPPFDMSHDVRTAMADTSTRWTYMNACGDVADQLERVARALAADVIVIGKSRHARLRIAPSVARRLLVTTRHVVVVV